MDTRCRVTRLLVLLLAGAAPLRAQAPSPGRADFSGPFDLIIRNGRVVDGSGNPWFRADVAVLGGRIAAIGSLEATDAMRTIDARGRLVVPGFIDIHSHAEEGLVARDQAGSDASRRRAAPNLVSQGITTVVVNQDGRGPWPIAPQKSAMEKAGVGPNVILMIGHNTIRQQALGADFRRIATADEIGAMRAMIRQGIEEGAFGLSAGLEYVPGRWSTTEEIVALVEEVGLQGGVYIVHERSSGATPMWFWPSRDPAGPPTMLETILEDVEVAERTGVPVVATHIKARGADFWGSGRAMIHLIDRARARGVPIWADQYPYATTGSDGSTVLLPTWFLRESATREREGERPDFAADLRAALGDDAVSADLRRDISHEITRRGGPDRLVVFDHPDSSFIGQNLRELSEAHRITAVEMAILLQLEGFPDRRGGARLRGFSLSEIDIEAFAARPWVVTASDAGIALPEDGPVHARFYGTFPRKIREYALERGVLSLEDAIRSATSLPAQILGLRERGMVREGYHADLVILDLERLRDTATFFEPHRYPEGVDHVLVNGVAVVEDGALTWTLAGRVIPRRETRLAR